MCESWDFYFLNFFRFSFLLVLVGILLCAIFRVSFFGAALSGAERGRLTFVILDKMAVVFFTWALLGFVYM